MIVNTHFLPAEIIAALRRKGDLATPQLTVTTDFETHRLWVNQPCDHYFTATEEGAAYLQHWGVAAETITVTGIPVHPVFSQPKTSAECRARLGLGDDRPVILQLAGGFGLGPVEKLFTGLLAVANGRWRSSWSPAATRNSASGWSNWRFRRGIGRRSWASPRRSTSGWPRPTWCSRSPAG